MLHPKIIGTTLKYESLFTFLPAQ